MANQFQTIAQGAGILKNYYQGPIVTQFNEDLPIWRGASKGDHAWSGLQVNRPLKVRRNQGIGATSDGGPLPAVGVQTTIQAVIQAKFNYLRFGLTGPLIKASMSNVGSFVRDAAFELEEGYKDLKWDVNRQLSWDGTGVLARMNASVVGSSTIVLKGREDTEAALKFVDVGMVFDIYTSAGVLVQSGVTVQSVTSGTAVSSTATLTVSPAVTASADDIIVRTNSYGQEIQGLLTQLDGGTSTVFGIDRATYISTQGNVVDLNGAQMTLDSLQQAEDLAQLRGQGATSALYSDFPSRRMYQKLLTADKRFVNTVQGDGGFSNKDKTYLEFNGVPWVADQSCPTRVFFLNDKFIVKYVLAELEFCDETGAMMIAQTGADSFEVRLRFFANLFNEMPAGCAVLRDYISP